ncbi:hypothetical protein TraAM80_03098 [Trypanosoma rangeli]|uniref:Uncharacterized protein n=1 Tax=Trypanosoma rangeli TaxID=5698 RepID=A0A3R7NKF8_TRYRA|nr:uncharacterized protein TraAM80_03098 [Trypanosoma rangeli]RNF07818.1 hypothetical protein TraAM80_03098 [Trypanosoma rangeli]|eukprot:RNF07818.1 hypothetical protein TraAM80_03098 [Trypanosoma rangeli]
MSFGMRIGLAEPHHRRASGGLRDTAAASGMKDGGDNLDDGPQPSCSVPTPEPRVLATAATVACASLPRASSSALARSTRKGGIIGEGPSSTSSLLDGAALRSRLRRPSSAAHLRRLDLRATAMDDVEWSWFCQDLLSTMSGLTFLGLAEMGLTDRRLAELLRSCQLESTRCGTAASFSSALSSRRATGLAASRSVAAGDAASSISCNPGLGRRTSTQVSSSVANLGGRRALRRLGVLDLSGNRLTHRSATPLGKLLLWAADTLDELHLSGNPLQDYGLQILGIYLAKLQLASLQKERHFFPLSLVRQHAALFTQRRRQAEHEARVRYSVPQGPTHASPQERRCGDASERGTPAASCGDAQIHLGISFLDLRGCQGSARGISEVLAGASHSQRLETLLLAHNRDARAALVSPRPACKGVGISPQATCSRDEATAGTDPLLSACRFSSFKELHYPCALTMLTLSGVPLSKLCTPIGCRELFLNVFFCCPKLNQLDVSDTFDILKLPSSLLLQLLMRRREAARDPRIYWGLQLELEGATEFTLDTVMLAHQACVGGILCELAAHAAFNAQRRQSLAPPAFCHLQSLNLKGTGITDRAARGLAIAVSSAALTGVLSSLTVLNLADNLLSVDGCMQVMHAFIIGWPVPPSVLSALSLQGNAGVHRDDDDSIMLLRQGAEAAVWRRREERQRCGLVDEASLPLPLRIYLGAVGTEAFCIADGEADKTTAEKEAVEDAGGVRQDVTVADENKRDKDFSTFHFGTGGAVLIPQTAVRPFVEVPASASFLSPLAAQLAATCDVSSIHAGETPRRFLFSVPPTPSALQRTTDPFYPPEQPQKLPEQQYISEEQQRRRSVPILSPAVANENPPIMIGSTAEVVAGETWRSSLVNVKPATEFSTPALPVVVPFVTTAQEGHPWARDAARARDPSCSAGCEVTPLRSHDNHVLRGTLTSFQREPSSIFASSPHSSKALKFGCLFAAMDAAGDRGSKEETENSLTRCYVSSMGYRQHGDGVGDAEAKEAHVSRGAAEVPQLEAAKNEEAVEATGDGLAVGLESEDADGFAGKVAAAAAVAFKPKKGRCVKSFVMSYYHPVGHVFCRGWRLLHRGDSVGEDARACVERDVWKLLQPLDTHQGDAVVNSVSFVMPSAEGMDDDAEYGATRLQIVSNEHRSALAERLQQHANMEDGIIAFPLFMQALRRSEDDTVEVIAAMLDAAHCGLPAKYAGSTTEELVHARHGSEDVLMAEIGAVLAAADGETAQMPNGLREEDAADFPFFSANSEDVIPLAEKPVAVLAEEPQLLPPQSKETMEVKKEGERMESETAAPTAAVCRDPPAPHTPELQQAKLPGAVEPLLPPPDTTASVGNTVQLQPTPTTTSNAAAATAVAEVALKKPAPSLVDRVKTFVFSFPHREGHCLCRGWRLLHRTDAVGENARALLEADVLSFLQPALEDGQQQGVDGGIAKDADADASARRTVKSVSFTWEGSSSSTMQLRVVTSERRAVVSQRLQQNVVEGEVKLPRFSELLRSNAAYDTIHAVESYVQQQASEELQRRIASRYRATSTLVHYYHCDDAAMLQEIGAPNMAAVEATVDAAATDASDITSTPSGDTHNKDDAAVEATERAGGAVERPQAPSESPPESHEELMEGNTNKGIVEVIDGTIADVAPPSTASSSPLNLATPIHRAARVHSIELTLPGGKNIQRIHNSENTGTQLPPKNGEVNSDVTHTNQAFAERVRRLQFLAYTAMAKGAISLDTHQRHKLRICNGKWGRQRVTVAVEWDVFLVVYFVKGTALGITSRKTLVLVHPVAFGLRCFVDNNNGGSVEGRDRIIHFCLEHAHSPDELGVSSQEVERRLQEVSALKGSRSGASARGSLVSLQNLTNASLASGSSSVATLDSAASVPSTGRLLQHHVSFQVTVSSASKAREAVAAIRGAEQRAVKMIQQTMAEQDRHAVARQVSETQAA